MTVNKATKGAWTPMLSFSGSSTGITYVQQTGRYVKVGRIIKFEGHHA